MTLWMMLLITVLVSGCDKTDAGEVVLSKEIRAQIERADSTSSTFPYDQPVILSTPSRLSVLIGSTVVFPCRLDRDIGEYVLVWKRGKTGILFSGDFRVEKDRKFSLLDGSSLQIGEVTPQYAGEYTCQLRTKPPSEVVHILHVLVPPTITLDPEDGQVVVKRGDRISVRCNAEGYPPPTVTWTAVDGFLPGRVKEKQGNVLSIASADVLHAGIYQCTADNDVGESSSATVRITVLYAPMVTVRPNWIHAGLGSGAEFRCSASGEPSPTLYWTRIPGSVLNEDSHISYERHSNETHEELVIKIRRITQEHFGSYACFANNSINSTFKTAQISGLAEPVKFKSSHTGKDNGSFLITWTVKSYSPVIEYLLRIRSLERKGSGNKASPWTDVMIPVDAQQSVFHSHSYNITGLSPGVKYEVVMQARNDFGWNHPSEAFMFHTAGDPQVETERPTTDISLLPVVMTETSVTDMGFSHHSGQYEASKQHKQHPFPGLLLLLGFFQLIT